MKHQVQLAIREYVIHNIIEGSFNRGIEISLVLLLKMQEIQRLIMRA